MRNAQRFNFTEGFDAFSIPDALPQLPLSLTYQGASIEVSALLDTGASVNVLPYSAGVQLSAVWEEQTTSVILAVFAQIWQFQSSSIGFCMELV